MDSLIFTNDYVIAAKQVKVPKERAIEELENFFYDYRGKKVLSKEDLPSGKDTVIIPIADNNANATEPDFYFVFDRESILSSEVTKKIFKAHRSSFSKGFEEDLFKAFTKYNILINDLKLLNMYEVSFYNLDGTLYTTFSDRLISLYELIVHSIEGSEREVLSVVHIGNSLDDVSSYMKQFFSSINNKLLNALKKHCIISDFDEFIEISLPDVVETYNKSLLFKEMMEDTEKQSVKEILIKCLDTL